jgi:hypothetical protein
MQVHLLDAHVGNELTGVLTRWGSQFGFIEESALGCTLYIHHSDWRDAEPPQVGMLCGVLPRTICLYVYYYTYTPILLYI